jgi:hypothetical protein
MTAVLEVKSKTIGCCVEHFSMGDACSAEDFSNPLVAFVDRRRRSAPPIKLVVSIQAVGEKFWLAIIQREGLVDPPNKFAKSIGLDGSDRQEGPPRPRDEPPRGCPAPTLI